MIERELFPEIVLADGWVRGWGRAIKNSPDPTQQPMIEQSVNRTHPPYGEPQTNSGVWGLLLWLHKIAFIFLYWLD